MSFEHNNEPYSVAAHRQIGEPESGDAPMMKEVQRQVETKPVSTAAIAVGIGIGAGLLLTTLFSPERSRRERLAQRFSGYFPSGGDLRSSLESILPDAITNHYRS